MTIALHRAGIPASQVAIVHAELAGVDWEGLREHIEATVPAEWKDSIRYVRAGKTFFDMVERRFAKRPESPCWPSPSYRQCTSDLKRDPIDKIVRRELAEKADGLVVHCVGIRAEESASRAKRNPFTFNKRESKAGREVYHWYPIFDWLETKVRATVADAGQELHWAYGEGMTRLSCCFCIMASKRDLATAARLKPELLARYVELEERTGYSMIAKKTLREILADESVELPPVSCDCA